tara:strand:+ start:2194 stop:2526 length:333 start_codon:yes stop_codon:yes gene_type:complete
MSYTVKGTLKVINDTVVVSEKFKKRTVVLVDDSGQYPQTIELQSMQDRVSIFDSCKEGDRVEISFNLTGREWTNPQGEVKVFNTLDAWKVNSETPEQIKQTAEVEDDLPF